MEKVQPIRQLDQIARIKRNLKQEKSAALYALFAVGINTNLRVSDLLNLTWGQVWAEGTTDLCNHIYLREQKTGKARRIKINKNIPEALAFLLEQIPAPKADDPIFRNRVTRKAYHRSYIARRIKEEARKVGIQDPIAVHSLRKTWGYHAIKTFHQPLVLVQAAFNHATQQQTMDYLCLTDDDIEIVHETVVL